MKFAAYKDGNKCGFHSIFRPISQEGGLAKKALRRAGGESFFLVPTLPTYLTTAHHTCVARCRLRRVSDSFGNIPKEPRNSEFFHKYNQYDQ